ncbi:hypothetical protein JOE21_000144 [Desmospora profundinema]|uniref:Uncharacterized protein n=1 Tax=Desmospora profundinema TaxID=1571184 RepID=A0ABU1IHB2_9BACL|nr:hypothetical protein [Desmospora profundinema]
MKTRSSRMQTRSSSRMRVTRTAGVNVPQISWLGGGLWKNIFKFWGFFQTCRRFWGACKKWWGPLSGFLAPGRLF